jgi:hypothetical protein
MKEEKTVDTALRNKKIEFIKEIVSAYLKHPIEDYDNKSRKRESVKLKYVTMFLILKRIQISLVELGKMFGYDHATVIHARKQISGYILFDQDLKKEIDQMLALIDHKLTIVDGKLDLENDYYYIPLNECSAVKIDKTKSISFTGFTHKEIKRFLGVNNIEGNIIDFCNTNMFLIKKKEKEENGENRDND